MAALVTRASPGDVPAIRELFCAAYSKYIDRIGKLPAPMVADYDRLVDLGQVHVLRDDMGEKLVGAIVLEPDTASESLQIGNVVVDPAAQGRGHGRVLLESAERVARDRDFAALTLFTNVKMHENFGLYAKMGYGEVGRRIESGYERVYFRKGLS